MNLVRKLVCLALMMPLVYCATAAVAVEQVEPLPSRRNAAAKRPRDDRPQMSDAQVEAKTQALISEKQRPLMEMLSQQLEALQTLQQVFQGIIDSKKATNMEEAFKLACFASNIGTLLTDTQSVITCLNSPDRKVVVIAIGATPAVLQAVDQFTGYMDNIRMDCESLKGIARGIHGITDDIPNVDLTPYVQKY